MKCIAINQIEVEYKFLLIISNDIIYQTFILKNTKTNRLDYIKDLMVLTAKDQHVCLCVCGKGGKKERGRENLIGSMAT